MLPVRFVNSDDLPYCNGVVGITHNDKFHCDDIMGIALLGIQYRKPFIYRISHDAVIPRGKFSIVFDIGLGRFDHHQVEKFQNCHPAINGEKPVPYASLGLLWDEFGMRVLKKCTFQAYSTAELQSAFRKINETLIKNVDASDNGIFAYSESNGVYYQLPTISNLICRLNPIDCSIPDNENKGLKLAVKFGYLALKYACADELNHVKTSENETQKLYNKVVTRVLMDCCNITDNSKEDLESFWTNHSTEFFDAFISPNHELMRSSYERNVNFLVDGMIEDLKKNPIVYKGNYNLERYTLWNLFEIAVHHDDFAICIEKVLKQIIYEFQKYSVFCKDSKEIVDDALMTSLSEKESIPANIKSGYVYAKHILVLPEKADWTTFVPNDIWFVITPTSIGNYKIKPVTEAGFYRKAFPKSYWGYNRNYLNSYYSRQKLPAGISFVHNAGFLAISKNLPDAIKLCEVSYGNNFVCKR